MIVVGFGILIPRGYIKVGNRDVPAPTKMEIDAWLEDTRNGADLKTIPVKSMVDGSFILGNDYMIEGEHFPFSHIEEAIRTLKRKLDPLVRQFGLLLNDSNFHIVTHELFDFTNSSSSNVAYPADSSLMLGDGTPSSSSSVSSSSSSNHTEYTPTPNSDDNEDVFKSPPASKKPKRNH